MIIKQSLVVTETLMDCLLTSSSSLLSLALGENLYPKVTLDTFVTGKTQLAVRKLLVEA